jgi:hypothetical protein
MFESSSLQQTIRVSQGLGGCRSRNPEIRGFRAAVLKVSQVRTRAGVPSRFVLEFVWRKISDLNEDIGSGGEVNQLVSKLVRQGLPSINLAHRDLTSGEQRPEQHGGGLSRRQHRLGLDPAFELLVEPFDRVGGSRTLPLADG